MTKALRSMVEEERRKREQAERKVNDDRQGLQAGEAKGQGPYH